MRRLPLLLALGLLTACSTLHGRRLVNPDGRIDDIPYSHVAIANGMAYIAGTIGVDPATGQAPADPADEIRLAMDGVQQKLALAGLAMDDIVSMQVFCADISLYGTFNEIYRTYFTSGEYPARAFIGSGPILRNGRFELCAIAAMR